MLDDEMVMKLTVATGILSDFNCLSLLYIHTYISSVDCFIMHKTCYVLDFPDSYVMQFYLNLQASQYTPKLWLTKNDKNLILPKMAKIYSQQ